MHDARNIIMNAGCNMFGIYDAKNLLFVLFLSSSVRSQGKFCMEFLLWWFVAMVAGSCNMNHHIQSIGSLSQH
jgi:hypothetical protein